MAPKRQRGEDALMYFVDAVARMQPLLGRASALTQAHKWGEAMVQSELEALRNEGVSAADRYARLSTSAEKWYSRGFRYFLLPKAADAPARLHEQRGDLPDALLTQPEHQLRSVAFERAEMWAKRLTSTEVFATAQSENNAEAAALRTPPKPVALARPSPAVAKQQPRNALKADATSPALPSALAMLLRGANITAIFAPSAPHPCMRAQITALVRDQRIIRASEGEQLETLPLRACALQMRLEAHGLGALLGNGKGATEDDACLRGAGLELINRGGFNSIYACGSKAEALLRLLPPEVSEQFAQGEVVLRAPLTASRWLTFDELVGEVHNVLFTACRGLGPRVTALAYARKASNYKSRTQQGAVIVLYKVCVFMERATMNADERYVANALPVASALHRAYYFRALLVSIFRMSQEGFVHLDATLRNFVDFYPSGLTRTATRFAIKIIDVDSGCFRRLRPDAGTGWRSLFLFNLLFVMVHLKIRLADRWDPSQYWNPVRACVEQLIAQLPSSASCISSALLWKGAFEPHENFPDVLRGPLAGDTDAATTGAANAFLRFYLLEQPINEALLKYVNFVAPTPEQARGAAQWYDRVYRAQMLPSMRFFLAQLKPRLGVPPRLFVHVARDFLVTPHAELQRRHLPAVPLAADHHPATPKEAVLGITAP